MLAYIICFIITTLIIALSENNFKRNRKKTATFLGISAVVILSVFAGIRDYSVGTDINFYILPGYREARNFLDNYFNLLKYDAYQLEATFLFFEYVSAKVFHSPHFVMFVISLITNSFAYAGMKNQHNYINIPLSWLAYCLIFFNISLNLMRQSISVAIVFYMFSLKDKLNWKKAFFLTLIATLFHISGIFGFLLYFIYLLISRKNNIPNTRFWAFLIFLSLPLIMPYAANIMKNMGLLTGKFLVFVGNQGKPAVGNIIFRSIGFLSFFLFFLRTRKKNENTNTDSFLLYVGIMNILLLLNNNLLFIRIGKYFEIFEVIYFPLGIKIYSQKKGQRLVIYILLVVLLVFYWYYLFIVLNTGSTYPYLVDPNLFRAY